MGLNTEFYVTCDLCGTDAGRSDPTMTEAWSYVQRGGWWTNRGMNAAVCEDCYDETKAYHAQRTNLFCVLCQSGEHIAIIK